MNYKFILVALLALFTDIVIGIFYPNVGPIALVLVAFYFALRLDYLELVPIIFVAGFMYDISLLSGSIFNVIYLVGIAIITKLIARKVVDFSNELIQVLFVMAYILVRTLGFYLIYDRSINSVFLNQNLIALLITIVILVGFNSVIRIYGKQN